MSTPMTPSDYFNAHVDDFLDEIGKIIAFKSISTDPAYKPEMKKAADWVKAKLESLGFTVNVIPTSSNPVLIASYVADPKKKTVVLYGHYDVQPVEPIKDWNSKPFTVKRDDKRLYARGIIDNKGQFMMHMSAIESIIKTDGKLPVNVKWLIEGDEETGSADLDTVIKDNTELLKADLALISDGEMIGDDNPVIETSFRGVVNCELKVIGPKEDLHSGMFGGTIANPAYELAKLIGKLYDKDYKITIPHFYDDVEPVSAEEKKLIEKKADLEKNILELSGSKKFLGEKGYSTFERMGLRPTIQIIGIETGYNGVGYRNIVPSEIRTKFNFRLVAHQDPKKIFEEFSKFIKDNISDAVTYELSEADFVEAVKVDINNEYVRKVQKIITDVYGKEPIINFVGGTLPVVNSFKDHLHIPIVSVPLSQEDCGMHSPNERLLLDAFKRGVNFSIQALQSIS
jgi:acetylornithine deacetylase/succinyl-diaminopimelate desuccinylase-like protein